MPTHNTEAEMDYAEATPEELRAWATRYRDEAEDLHSYTRTDPVEPVVRRLRLTAAALERWAEALERGERVCRWGRPLPDTDPDLYHTLCDDDEVFTETPDLGPYCYKCGGRVVLGEKEASDE